MKRRFAALLAVALAGCGPGEPPGQGAPTPASPQTITSAAAAPGAPTATRTNSAAGATPPAQLLLAGRKVYNFRCYYCHGYSGDARTLAATYITPPPRSFVAATPQTLPLERIHQAVRDGKPGTAMRAFANVISDAELAAVSAFVFDEFVVRKAPNTRYHTTENGWANHERYKAAYPFALGEIPLTKPTEEMSAEQLAGLQLYRSACVTCHDRGQPTADGVTFESRPVSFPRFNFDHRNPQVDASSSATPYRLHDTPPRLAQATAQQAQGAKLFQDNCAFCHAADGTAKNWIGAFLEPHPRNLTDPAFMGNINRQHLRRVIRDGLPNTSMPAWKSVLSEEEIEAVIAYIDKAFHPVAK